MSTADDKRKLNQGMRDRFIRILGRFVRLEDSSLCDRDFVRVVVARWEKDHAHYLVDVSE